MAIYDLGQHDVTKCEAPAPNTQKRKGGQVDSSGIHWRR